MGYKKQIKGDGNEASEQLSHNRITIEGGSSALILVIFFCVLIAAALLMMVIIHLALVEILVTVTVVGAFVVLWIIAFAFLLRQVNDTQTTIAVNAATRRRAAAEASVAHAGDHYILWIEPDGDYQFRGSTMITENRQYLPREVNPPSQQEAILTCYDQGMSGRAIEKWLKDNGTKVAYREIAKTLDLYRPDWNKKAVVNADPPKEEV